MPEPRPARPAPPAAAATAGGVALKERRASPFPLGQALPSVYHGDPFTQSFCAGLDQVLLPVITTLDGFHAYLDPATAPARMVEWLAVWVGLPLGGRWPVERARALVAAATRLHDRRGTRAALDEVVRIATGASPLVTESGGTSWSQDCAAALPGDVVPSLRIQVRRDDLGDLAEEALTTLLDLFVPAHVPWRLDLV